MRKYTLLIFDWEGTLTQTDTLATHLQAGVVDLLTELSEQDYFLAVATNKSRIGLAESLEKTGLQSFFMATRSADQTAPKPHPQMLIELMDELACEANETLMIGDNICDIQLARNAGVDAVLIASSDMMAQQCKPYRPIAIINSVTEIPNVLKS